MPSTRDLRRRIKSVRNTAQITRAMQMVAASKMRKAQQAAVAGRPYVSLMNRMLAEVSAGTVDFTHPLLERRNEGRRAVVLIGTDKGLCGALNTNLFREASRTGDGSTLFVAVGRKASQFVARSRRDLSAEFTCKDEPRFSEARAISKYVLDLFAKEPIRQVDVMYTNFVSTLVQRPQRRTFLPLEGITALEAGLEDEPGSGQAGEEQVAPGGGFEFEPDAADVLGSLLPHYLNYRLYQFLLECKASEHSARMVAMKNATDNANQLIKDLTLEYNKLRQAGITNELLEITSASLAVA